MLRAPTRCRGWTVADVAGHVVGTVVDITEGRLEGQGTPAVTDRQAKERTGRTGAQLAAELAGATPALMGVLASLPGRRVERSVAHGRKRIGCALAGVAAAFGLVACAPTKAAPGPTVVSATFECTGTAQTWTVPAGVTQAAFAVFGAQGGTGASLSTGGGTGGFGGTVVATFGLTPGEQIQINVGCRGGDGQFGGAGGFNGGGEGGVGGSGSEVAGGGGGASDVRRGGTGLADRFVVGGGGGGGGAGFTGIPGGAGGIGAGPAGEPGTGYQAGGTGGSQTSGGAVGGALGAGGNGAPGDGGGGGGFFGGGGGSTTYGGGGGGGSSYAADGGGALFDDVTRAGHGIVVISYVF
jgi:hypothetical protein